MCQNFAKHILDWLTWHHFYDFVRNKKKQNFELRNRVYLLDLLHWWPLRKQYIYNTTNEHFFRIVQKLFKIFIEIC